MTGSQIIPTAAIYAVMVCMKDGDCFFPDATPSVTVLLWIMGGYDTWVQPFARISGQLLASGMAVKLYMLELNMMLNFTDEWGADMDVS